MSCICQGCNKRYKVDLVIPTRLWNKIMPNGDNSLIEGNPGLLCGSCIMERIEELCFDADFWNLSKIPKNEWLKLNKA